MKIFVIGPGGVGKSTSGKILAEKFGYELIDLDKEFLSQIGHIGSYIESFGYDNYAKKNSELFYTLLSKSNENTVIVLSSGFLVHKGLKELVFKHVKTLKDNGVSILLLPSRDANETIEIVVKRQLGRGFGLIESNEREKIKERFAKYLKYGDIQIFSKAKPEIIADLMVDELVRFNV
ncbi:MAG TPA: shikimate kinase [Patescibacteria group bacterium]|nr:shikimate kinase [Patescibacteria group bacterium]